MWNPGAGYYIELVNGEILGAERYPRFVRPFCEADTQDEYEACLMEEIARHEGTTFDDVYARFDFDWVGMKIYEIDARGHEEWYGHIVAKWPWRAQKVGFGRKWKSWGGFGMADKRKNVQLTPGERRLLNDLVRFETYLGQAASEMTLKAALDHGLVYTVGHNRDLRPLVRPTKKGIRHQKAKGATR